MSKAAAAWHRFRAFMQSGTRRVRLEAIFAVQSGVAAGLAWFIATDVVGHTNPVFAPISAVIVLSSAGGLRWRRATELAGGVALGIVIGDAFIILIGVGPVQLAAVVTLAIIATYFFGGGNVAVGQAAASAVLVATLAPPTKGIFFTRFFDAMIGGVTALIVMSLLLPLNPLTRVRHAGGHALSVLADTLKLAARSLDRDEPELAEQALTTLRARDRDKEVLREALAMGRETALVSPIRWRSRAALARYAEAAVHVDRATRSVRVIQSQTSQLLRDDEPAPAELSTSLNNLAESVTALRRALAGERDPAKSRACALDAVRAAHAAYIQGVGLSGSVAVAQIDSAAVDLLCAAGLQPGNANALARDTAGLSDLV